MSKLFKVNSERVTKILMSLKLSLGTLGVSAYAMEHEKLGFWILAATGLLDVILSGFSKNESTGTDGSK